MEMDALLGTGLESAGTRRFGANAVLIRQGDAVGPLRLVRDGHAMACTYSLDGERGWVRDYAPGDWIGLEWMSPDIASPVEVLAATPCALTLVSRADLHSAMASTPALRDAVNDQMRRSLSELTERLIEARTLSAKGRICAELRRLARPVGVARGQFILRPVPVFATLAFRVGTTRESVSRTVSDLTKAGILERRPGALLILDMDGLDDRIV